MNMMRGMRLLLSTVLVAGCFQGIALIGKETKSQRAKAQRAGAQRVNAQGAGDQGEFSQGESSREEKVSHVKNQKARTQESDVQESNVQEKFVDKDVVASSKNYQAPATFGKSHFIVGMPAEEMARHCAVVPAQQHDEEAVDAYDMVCLGVFPQVLFSPHDEVCKTLVHLIDNEKKSIKIAAYAVTEPTVANALGAAAKRGVTIELVLDRSCLDMPSNKVKTLRKAGASVAIFDGKTREDGALMHNKFYLFEENLKNKKLLWTGSANTTKSGYTRNHENVMIMEDQKLFGRYDKEFKKLMKLADVLKS